jgi:hypothetical protein
MIIRITPDKEKARSMINMIKDREIFLSSVDIGKFSTIAAENYYEIIKELASVTLLLDGYKATGENAHKDLIDYLNNYKEITEEEIIIMDDLRIKRNKSSYEGKRIESIYLQNKKDKLILIINKLKKLVNNRL